MIKISLSIITLFVFSQSWGQWGWSNPKPSGENIQDIIFVNDDIGYILNGSSIFKTLNQGQQWTYLTTIESANDIDIKNSIGYIVSSNGDIFKSMDNGTQWTKLSTKFDQTPIKINVITVDTAFVASENNIYITTNGGSSWNKLSHQYRVLNIQFLNSKYGFAACRDGKVIKTVDGGLNWTLSLQHDWTSWSINTISFYNHQFGFAFSETGDIMRTVNGGVSWSKVYSGGFDCTTAYFINDSTCFAAGEDGIILKTVDFGNTWNYAGFDVRDPNDISVITFLNESIGFTGGLNGRIMKTSNTGTNWTSYSPTYFDLYDVDFPTNEIGYGVGFLGQIIKTQDAGENWQLIPSPTSNFLRSVSFIDENSGYILSDNDEIFKTDDGGTSWNLVNLGFPHYYEDFTTLEFISSDTIYISGGYNFNSVIKSVDGGQNWQHIASYSFKKIQFLNSNVGYALNQWNYYRRLYKTIDGGFTWTVCFETTSGDINSFHFISKEYGVLVGENGITLKTSDGGITWKELETEYIDYKAVRFLNKNVGYITGESNYQVHIFKTIDGGISWQEEIIPTIYKSQGLANIVITDSNDIFVGGESGLILKNKVEFEKLYFQNVNAIEISESTAIITCRVINNLDATVSLSYKLDESIYETSDKLSPYGIDTMKIFLNSLAENQTYLYQFRANIKDEDYYSTEDSFTTKIIVGLNEGIEESLRVYPNPTNGDIFVLDPNDKQILSISLCDSNGRVLISKQNSNWVDTSNLPAGLYILIIKRDDMHQLTRIIKK